MNLICLDIDDCIFPNDNTYVGRTDDSLEILEINLKRLVLILDKFDAKIFITSSWYSILKLENNKLSYLNYDMLAKEKELYQHEYLGYLCIKKYLEKYIIAMSCGNRIADIQNLLEQQHKVIALDDIDLSEIQNTNYLYLETVGLIDNRKLCKINKFFGE